MIKGLEDPKFYDDYFPDYSDNSGSDVEGDDLLKKYKDTTGFNTRPKYFYPLFNIYIIF